MSFIPRTLSQLPPGFGLRAWHLLLVALLQCSIILQARAQVPAESLFPIGGFGFFGTNSSLLSDAQLNTFFYGGSSATNAGNNGAVTEIMSWTGSQTGYVPASQIEEYVGNKSTLGSATDKRFFMANDWPGSRADPGDYGYDVTNTWGSVTGEKVSSSNEWYVAGDVQSNSNGYLLEELHVDQTKLDGNPFIIKPESQGPTTAHMAFVYRINQSDFTDAPVPSSTQTIYQIEYVVTKADNSTTTTVEDIKYGDYAAYIANPESHEPLSILSFGTPTKQKYAIKKTILVLPSGAKTIDCKLKKFSGPDAQQIMRDWGRGIFVRGLRVRSDVCEKLIKGELDAELEAKFADIKSGFSSAAWQKIPAVTAAGESQFVNWAALAYIDKKWQQWSTAQGSPTPKRIYMFQAMHTGGYEWYRAIYEDETGDVPPTLFSQCEDSWSIWKGSGGIPKYPTDAIPSSRSSTTDFTLFGFGEADLEYYTNNFQLRQDDCPAEHEAKAAFPPGRKPGKWVATIWTHMDHRDPEEGQPTATSTFRKLGEVSQNTRLDLLKALRGRGCFAWADTAFYIWDVLKEDGTTADGTYNSLKWRQDTRSMLGSEIRVSAWNALAYGAKGILWNTLNSDGGENVGLAGLDGKYDYDWWDDRTGFATGENRQFLTNFNIGSCDSSEGRGRQRTRTGYR